MEYVTAISWLLCDSKSKIQKRKKTGCYIENAKLWCYFQAHVIQGYSSFSHHCVLSLYESDQYSDFLMVKNKHS